MLVVACVGLVANLVSAYLLFGEHRHSLNVRGALFHVISDAIGSVGAIVASLAILLGGLRRGRSGNQRHRGYFDPVELLGD
jgi:cobalt-zinc-cadmium efflux system protein